MKQETIRLEVHEAHCPGCRAEGKQAQGVDPLGVMITNPSHGTQSKVDASLLTMHQKAAMDYARSQKR